MLSALVTPQATSGVLIGFAPSEGFFWIIGIIESSTIGDPLLPQLQLINLSSNILNLVKGELIVGQSSGAVASLVSTTGTNQANIINLNENTFKSK
jgi:hypothetical protein